MDNPRKEDPILTATKVRILLEFLKEASGAVEGEHLAAREDPILTATEVRSLLESLKEASGTVEDEHLTEEDLALYGEGDRGEADVERIDQHIASCETCAIRMEWRLTSQAFVASTVEGRSVFELFLAEVTPKLKRLLAAYRIPKADGEDILQQALLELLYQWEVVRDHKSWLFGTVRRKCLMFWRTNRRRIYSAVDATVLEWLSQPVAPSQERSDLLSELERLIERLPSRCRSLLRLRFQLGYEPMEVAQQMGYRPSSIAKITNRCIAALSRELVVSGLIEKLSRQMETRSKS